MRPRPHPTSVAMLLAVAVAGSAACGDGGGSPAAPTPVTTMPVDTLSEEAAARQAVDTWLSLIDAGNYLEAYEATGSFFRESVSAEEFRDIMEERLALLGAFESRTVSSTRRLTVLPDAPPGDYFEFEFDAVYELRPDAGERVTAVSETDEWRVVVIYLIR